MKLTNEMILRVLRSMPNRPWGIGSTRGDALAFARAVLKAAGVEELEQALEEARRAIGGHYVPSDCYATGPMTGDPIRDLVQCPACSAIALYEKAMKAK